MKSHILNFSLASGAGYTLALENEQQKSTFQRLHALKLQYYSAELSLAKASSRELHIKTRDNNNSGGYCNAITIVLI